MAEHIGIDTHGHSEPLDVDELTPEQLERLDKIEAELDSLVTEYLELANSWPVIAGYKKMKY